jgi:hypothetical protein
LYVWRLGFDRSPQQVRVDAARARLRLPSYDAKERVATARRGRYLGSRPIGDGMVAVYGEVPAVEWLELTATARDILEDWRRQHAQTGVVPELMDPDGAGLEVREAGIVDALFAMGHGVVADPGVRRGSRTHVHLLMPASVAWQGGDEPCEVSGHGFVPAHVGRYHASRPGVVFHRVFTDPVTGMTLVAETGSYTGVPIIDPADIDPGDTEPGDAGPGDAGPPEDPGPPGGGTPTNDPPGPFDTPGGATDPGRDDGQEAATVPTFRWGRVPLPAEPGRFPSDALRRYVHFRDNGCRFPGCVAPWWRCDTDHTEEWAADDGITAETNLASLCLKHHRAKTRGEWTYTLEPDGTCVWTSRRRPTVRRLTRPAPIGQVVGRRRPGTGPERDERDEPDLIPGSAPSGSRG